MESAAAISLLGIGGDAERMLALTALLSGRILSDSFGLRPLQAFQGLVLRFNGIEERLQLGGIDGNVCHCGHPFFNIGVVAITIDAVIIRDFLQKRKFIWHAICEYSLLRIGIKEYME